MGNAAGRAYQNAMSHNHRQNARIEHDRVLQQIILNMLFDHAELVKQYNDSAAFHRWLAGTIIAATYQPLA